MRRILLKTDSFSTLEDLYGVWIGVLFQTINLLVGRWFLICIRHLISDSNYTQYLAVSTLPNLQSNPALGERGERGAPGNIQIWSATPPRFDGKTSQVAERGEMRCELVLCVDGGSVMEMKFMTLGAWDDVRHTIRSGAHTDD
jgi:hypothetical protein